jgi:hypothetical protein
MPGINHERAMRKRISRRRIDDGVSREIDGRMARHAAEPPDGDDGVDPALNDEDIDRVFRHHFGQVPARLLTRAGGGDEQRRDAGLDKKPRRQMHRAPGDAPVLHRLVRCR